MKPYYSDDLVQLYHADCLEHPELWTCADVLCPDPPYGISWNGVANYTRGRRPDRKTLGNEQPIAGDRSLDARDTALELWGNRPRMVFGSWRKPRPECDHRLIWWKRGQAPGPVNASFMLQDEEIYVAGGGFVTSSPPKRSVFATDEPRSLAVAEIGHLTPKPIPLMEWLLERCQPEWTIADPFAGSGSTLVAAKRLGRKAIGVELEERYCEIAARRCAQDALPLWDLEVSA